MRTQFEEFVSRAKTWLWSAFWIAVAIFVDALAQSLAGASLPDLTIGTVVIPTTVFVGLLLNQISKYLHNLKAGRVE